MTTAQKWSKATTERNVAFVLHFTAVQPVAAALLSKLPTSLFYNLMKLRKKLLQNIKIVNFLSFQPASGNRLS